MISLKMLIIIINHKPNNLFVADTSSFIPPTVGLNGYCGSLHTPDRLII